jgi:hypothetical protein
LPEPPLPRNFANAAITGDQHELLGIAPNYAVECGEQGGDLALPTLQRLRDQQPVRDVAFTEREVVDAALKLKPFAWSADPTRLTRVSIVGCGTAYIAELVANYWIERWARLPVEIDVASEYRYRGARRGVIALRLC